MKKRAISTFIIAIMVLAIVGSGEKKEKTVVKNMKEEILINNNVKDEEGTRTVIKEMGPGSEGYGKIIYLEK